MHILVVEDERRLANLLKRVLTEERHVVDVAYDGAEGLHLAASGTYDLVVLDVMLPEVDGIQICRTMRAERVDSAVLMLTKPFAMEELLARVNAVLRRRSHGAEAGTELRVGDLTLDLVRHEVRRDNHIIELTAKEFALLEFLMRHPGQVLTRTQITDHVWRYDLDALSNVVDIYIHYLREKIDKGFLRPLIKTVRGVGYRMDA